MIKVAELFSDEDKIVKQRIDAKNELESYVCLFFERFIFTFFSLSYTYALRNQIKDQKGHFQELTFTEISTITNAVEKQIKWIDSNANANADEFKKQKQQLERVVLQIMSKIHGYKSSNNTRSQYHGEL